MVRDAGCCFYSRGSFSSVGGVAMNAIARWYGLTWSPLGPGANGHVGTLATRGDGGMIAGGGFSTVAGGTAVAAFVACGWVLVTPDAAPVVVTPIEAEPEPKSRRRGK